MQGVGSKVAIGIRSALPATTLAAAIAAADRAAPATSLADALSGLADLGHRQLEAQPAAERVLARLAPGAALDAVIHNALRELAR